MNIDLDFTEQEEYIDMTELDERTDLFPVRSVDGVTADPSGNIDLSEARDAEIKRQIKALQETGVFDGEDGISPVVNVDPTDDGYRITITDKDGVNVIKVKNGERGKDGISPQVSVIDIAGGKRVTIIDAISETSFYIYDGKDGYTPEKGKDYTDGKDGVSPVVRVSDIAGGHRVTITDKNGTESFDVMDGSGAGDVTSAMLDDAISDHNTNTDAHNDIRLLIEGLTSRLNTLADSDDITLDQMSEMVSYVKANRSLIESITTDKVNVADIIDNLTTNVSNKPLSAKQGVALKALIDALQTNQQAALDGKLSLSGGTMTGEIKIGQGDGYGIQLGTDGRINATDTSGSATCTILGVSGTTNALIGHSSFNTTLRGKATRPTYNGRDLALKSDLDEKLPTSTYNTHKADATHITSTERTDWNSAKNKVDGLTTETWTFTLEDGSTVTKAVYVG